MPESDIVVRMMVFGFKERPCHFFSDPRPGRGRHVLAHRDPSDPATLPTLAGSPLHPCRGLAGAVASTAAYSGHKQRNWQAMNWSGYAFRHLYSCIFWFVCRTHKQWTEAAMLLGASTAAYSGLSAEPQARNWSGYAFRHPDSCQGPSTTPGARRLRLRVRLRSQ